MKKSHVLAKKMENSPSKVIVVYQPSTRAIDPDESPERVVVLKDSPVQATSDTVIQLREPEFPKSRTFTGRKRTNAHYAAEQKKLMQSSGSKILKESGGLKKKNNLKRRKTED